LICEATAQEDTICSGEKLIFCEGNSVGATLIFSEKKQNDKKKINAI
jgi:hypothetical protein